MKTCKHCDKQFNPGENIGAHTKWCLSNPKRKEYKNSLVHARDCRREQKAYSNQFIKAKSEDRTVVISQESRDKWSKSGTGKKHTEATKQHLREKALKSNHRRLVRSCRKYTTKSGDEILLDSAWEEILAKRLDFLDVKWIRPKPLKWIDSDNIEHNYFPDFYLTDYNVYLDPKNPYAYKVQKEKIDILMITYDNIVILRSKEDCENYLPQ